jgi:CheY-like chemotaxis protein
MARILVAEDEAALRNQIVRALAAEGHDAIAAADGGEALDVLVREGGRFDLLLTDIKMPVMDGIALALAAARLPGPRHPADDRLRRPARARLRARRADPRHTDEAVRADGFAKRDPRGDRREGHGP